MKSTQAGTTGSQIIRLSDFDEAAALFSQWQGRFEQISRGRFEATLQIVRGEFVRIAAIKANQRVLIQGRDGANLFAIYPVIAGNAESLWQSRRLNPGQLVVTGTHTEVNHCSARKSESLGVSLQPKVLEEAARLLLASDVEAVPQDWTVFTPSPEAFLGFQRHLAQLLNPEIAALLRGTPDGHRLEQECVRLLVNALFKVGAPRPRLSPARRSRLIRRAEEFLRSHLSDSIGAIDLCRELGVSDRTLRLAFSERFGLGPMEYYKCLRLNAVRSRLKAEPQGAVSQAAQTFGFHHLGHFAADYHRQFGEYPSATLRQVSNSFNKANL